MIIIPAIDIIDKKIVRLRRGEFNQAEYYPNSPLEQSKIFKAAGFEWIHIVDLMASKTGTINTLDIIKQIKSGTGLKIEFGGGIRDEASFSNVLKAGVDKVIIGSLAVSDRVEFEHIVENSETDKILIAADVKNEMIAIKGWTEKTSVSVYDLIKYCLSLHINNFLCTDISSDGMLSGTNINLYTKILEQFPGINLTASGGVNDIQDVQELVKMNIHSVVIGKAIYEGIIDLKELAQIGK